VSYSLDVNVLLYASDRSSDRHPEARRFLGVRTLYSNDRDFRKFQSLDLRNPFA
jgi:predicted nucleic acid-binding protein